MTSASHWKSGDSKRFAKNEMRQKAAMLKESVAKRTCGRRRGSRSSTDPPIAKLTIAATSAETG